MLDRLIHGEPLRRRLLARNDEVDEVTASKTHVGDIQQTVGVRRQIDPHDLCLLISDMIDKPGILMGKAVMVLSPDVR